MIGLLRFWLHQAQLTYYSLLTDDCFVMHPQSLPLRYRGRSVDYSVTVCYCYCYCVVVITSAGHATQSASRNVETWVR